MGYEIREAQLEKIPYMIVIGKKEMETETVRPRMRSGQDMGSMKLDAFIERLRGEAKYPLR